jgi:signal transduction histidine kinase
VTYSSESQPDTRRILAVDDSKMNRDLMAGFLEALGYEARMAENGRAAIEAVQQAVPDLILLDVDMPEMDGFEVLGRLREHPDWMEIPVVMISGRDDVENIARALELGADDFMSKPFNRTILRARLRSSLERRDLRLLQKELLFDLERSYADLHAAEEARDMLVHMIAHDLGNPLSVIRMNAEMLEMLAGAADDGIPVDKVRDRVGHISRSAGALSEMIQSMLDVSKLESGDMPVDSGPVAVCAELAEQAGQFRMAAEEKSISLDAECSDPALSALADPDLLRRMLSNLILNAIKYAEGATAVVLSAESAEEGVRISVTDNGSGIPDELHDRIFDKFYQVESRQTGVRAGVGLGLTFCRLAASAQEGSIRAESPPGGGTRFVITLPATQ